MMNSLSIACFTMRRKALRYQFPTDLTQTKRDPSMTVNNTIDLESDGKVRMIQIAKYLALSSDISIMIP